MVLFSFIDEYYKVFISPDELKVGKTSQNMRTLHTSALIFAIKPSKKLPYIALMFLILRCMCWH